MRFKASGVQHDRNSQPFGLIKIKTQAKQANNKIAKHNVPFFSSSDNHVRLFFFSPKIITYQDFATQDYLYLRRCGGRLGRHKLLFDG